MRGWESLAMGFLLVLFRCTGLMMTAPLFGTRAVPTRVRMGLAVVLALVAFQAAGLPGFPRWAQIGPLLLAVLGESLIGVAAGMGARFVIEAASAAGHTAGLAMGIGFAATIDPLHGAESTALSELLVFLSLAVALAAGMHREAVVWLCRSVIETPPGAAVSVAEVSVAVVSEAARAAALAIRLAFPVMAAVLFGYVALGLVGRVAPQVAAGNLGFALALLAGGGALYLVSPTLAHVVAQSARKAFIGS
jgi:flagellar biosynthesis protein FliR